MSDSQPARPLTYAERLGGGARAKALHEQIAADKADRQAETSAIMDRRNHAAGTLLERIDAAKARDELVVAEKVEAKQGEQAHIAERLGTMADSLQENLGLSYAERVEQLTGASTEISTKDLRSPSVRKRDADAKRAREIEQRYDDFGAV